jgi:hypothetical protein
MVYSEEQVLDSILRPLIKGFRLYGDRTLAPPVAVLLNSCDANHEAWHHLLQADPAVTRFDMVVCRKPVLLEEIPRVLAHFTRAYTNKVFTRQPNVTAADALAEAVTPMFSRETEPVVLQYGKAPVDVWAVSKPSSSAAALASGSTFASNLSLATPPPHPSMLGLSLLPLPDLPFDLGATSAGSGLAFPPSVALAAEFAAESMKPRWTSVARDAAVIEFIINQLEEACRVNSKLSQATTSELLDALNFLVSFLRPIATTTAAYVPFYAEGGRYRSWRSAYWTYDKSNRLYVWGLAPAAAASTATATIATAAAAAPTK